mgnify:CR=1 FL=1
MTELDWHADRGDHEGLALLDLEPQSTDIDMVAVRGYRLGRVRAEMAKRGIGALIISDPVNIRYACGARNMQVFCARNTPSRYLLVTAGRTVLFEFTGCEHLADGLETIDEVRPATTARFVAAAPDIARRPTVLADDMLDTVTELVGWEQSLKNELIVARATRQPRGDARARLERILTELNLLDLRERFAY